jgi:DHA1 family tetracycline resistance protein-like MFS transporter
MTSQPVSEGTPPRFALLIVFLTVFIDLLGFGIVLPVMPRQAEPYLSELGVSPIAAGGIIGILFSVFSLMQFIFSPIWGRLSDRFGRKPLLILSLLGSVVFYALYGYAVSLPFDQSTLALGLMLFSRVGAGIAGASVGTAAAVIADCTTPERRARGMALIGIAFGAGFTLGPLIAYFGLIIFNERPWGVGALASLLSFVALLLAVFVFRETRVPGRNAAKEFFSISRTLSVLRIPAVGGLILIYFLAIFSFANFEATLARFTRAAFGMADDDNFLVFAAIGAVLVVAGGLYRPLAKRYSEISLMTAGLVQMIVGLGGLAMVSWSLFQGGGGTDLTAVPSDQGGSLKTAFYIASAFAVWGFAFVNPSVSALVSRSADSSEQGEVLGVNQSFASLGRILGPLVGSLLFAAHSSHAMPFVVAVLTLFCVGAILVNVTRSIRKLND